jgi:hypothetical protein
MKVQLDFSSPENCIKNIVKEGDDLAALLYSASTDVYKADEALLMATAKLSLSVRSNTGVKVTEGMVQAPARPALQVLPGLLPHQLARLRMRLPRFPHIVGCGKVWCV